MKRISLPKFMNIECCYLLLSLMIFLFISNESGTGLKIYIPYINGYFMYWHCVLTAITLIIMGIKYKFKFTIDKVIAFLFFKTISDLIGTYFNNNSTYDNILGYYCSSIISLTSYLIFLQTKSSNIDISKKFYLIFSACLSVQVIWTFSKIDVSYMDVYYKSFLNIPFAASNVIAGTIAPLAVIPFFTNSSDTERFISMLISILGIVLTKSRGGFIILVISFYFIYKYSGKENNRYFKYVCMLMSVMAMFFLVSIFHEYIISYLMGYSTNGFDVNSMTSGRFNILEHNTSSIIENLFLGQGMGIHGWNVNGSHNLLVDLLMKNGLIGFILYISALIYVFKSNSFKNSVYLIVLTLFFIDSMIEVTYFNYKNDAIFWSIAALAMKEKKKKD